MLKIVASALIVTFAALVAHPAPVSVTVSELIAHPDDHYDQRFTVSGILKFSTDGALICEMPSRATTRGYESCIDIATSYWPYGRFDWSKRGALIAIIGYFTFTCSHPDVPDEDGVQRICLHTGWRGYINVESVSIGGYVTCDGDECAQEDTSGAHEMPLASAAAKGIVEFARTLVSAARSRRAERIVAITFPTLRTETRFDLTTGAHFDHYWSEVANAPAGIIEPGTGFRLFDVDKSTYTARHLELCLCVKGDCASKWSQATAHDYGSNFSCHYVTRDGTTWYLLY